MSHKAGRPNGKPSASKPRQAGATRGRLKRTGDAGENAAVLYLEDAGFRILERNWRAPQIRNEIDVIAEEGNCLVFVEVKTARTETFGDPATWIDPRKQRAITRAARAYVAACKPAHAEMRFDAILITSESGARGRNLQHVRAAFLADDE